MITWSLKAENPNKIWVGQIKEVDVLFIQEQMLRDNENNIIIGQKVFVLGYADPFSIKQYGFPTLEDAQKNAISLLEQKMKLTYILLNAYQEKIERMMDGKEG